MRRRRTQWYCSGMRQRAWRFDINKPSSRRTPRSNAVPAKGTEQSGQDRSPAFDVHPDPMHYCLVVKETRLSRPELAFIASTRVMLGAGIALLLADRLSAQQRKAAGATLALVGLITTLPAAWAVFGRCDR
jgi:hypothetical protein